MAARTADNDNEGGELAQLMEALGDDERAAGGIRFGRDDKVSKVFCIISHTCRTFLLLVHGAPASRKQY